MLRTRTFSASVAVAVGASVAAPLAIEAYVQLLARTNRAFSQELSRGPVDPQQNNPNAAWKIPVRRISSRYYQGWKLQRVARGVWRVYNDSREAYYIEYGIHTSPRRVPRPIRRRALLKTLHFIDSVGAGRRVWEGIFSPLGNRGRAGRWRGSLAGRGFREFMINRP